MWVASGSIVKIWAYTSDRRSLDLRVSLPAGSGAKATDQGQHEKQGIASPNQPVYLEFTAAREGYYQLAAKLRQASDSPVRAYLKVEYEAPRTSTKF